MIKYSNFSSRFDTKNDFDLDYFSIAPHDSTAPLTDGELDAFMRSLDGLAVDPAPIAPEAPPSAPDFADDLGQRLQRAREAADAGLNDLADTEPPPAADLAEKIMALATQYNGDIDYRRKAQVCIGPLRAQFNARAAERGLAQRLVRTAARASLTGAKACVRREVDRERKRTVRGSAKTIRARRLAALSKATANPKGDKFLEQMRGREREIVDFREAMALAPGASSRELASVYERLTGVTISRKQAHSRRSNIEKLESPDGLWHRWK